VTHGDQFDPIEGKVEKIPAWALRTIDIGYETVRKTVDAVDGFSRKKLKRNFNLVSRLKNTSKGGSGFILKMEQAAIKYAKEHTYDGVICGHYHTPTRRMEDGILYMNAGDWVSNFTALTMDKDGEWQIVRQSPAASYAPQPVSDDGLRAMTEKMIADARKLWPGLMAKKSKFHKPGKDKPL
jgi:UDP-2,3-diacylglucosamine pyrophosphatase LpxH